MEISIYTEKLNKVDGNIYVIEEMVQLTDGMYEAPLAHDNVNTATLAVWTGPKLTGERIQSYALSTPSLTPWKRTIRLYADVPMVYISYETDGDIVEAADVNLLQADLIRTQEGINTEEIRAEAVEQILADKVEAETTRAEAAEKVLTDDLTAETTRAKAREDGIAADLAEEISRAVNAEIGLAGDLDAEVARANAAENTLTDNLMAETTRATGAERALTDDLTAEINRSQAAEHEIASDLEVESARAIAAEKILTDDLAAETARAEAEEKDIRVKLSAETTRAENVEKTLTDNLSAEVTRSKGAEKVLADNLAAEVVRAKAAEKTVTDNLASEVTRAKAAEKTNTDSITAETTRAKAKETELQGKIQTETNRATAAEDAIRSTITTNKPIWEDKYTRNEVDNKFSALESAVDWKESVDNFAAIAKAYPNPQDGWTVNVKDTDYTYRWSGTAWVAISANAIPKATKSVDGLLSKEDKTAYDDANLKKHNHDNKSVIDKITQALLDNWTTAYNHISDAVKHITAAERTNWNAAHTHISNKSNPHGVTAAQAGAAPASHTHGYLPLSGGTVTGNVTFNTSLTGLDWNMNTDYAKAYFKNTGDGDTDSYFAFETGDNGNEYFRWLQKNGSTTTELMNLKSDGLRVKGTKVAVEGHTHTKSQITDMPTKVSQFTNDSGYITQADVDTSHNHTHANKTVLDKITQVLLDNWNAAYTHVSDAVKHVTAAERTSWNTVTNKVDKVSGKQLSTNDYTVAEKTKLAGIATGANNYVHPTTHPASMITQDATHRFATDTEKTSWNKILFSATITVPASGWSASAPYTQTISITGLTAAMDIMPTLNVTGSSTAAQVASWKKALGMIDDGTTANGSITFKCYSKKPTVDIPLYLKSV